MRKITDESLLRAGDAAILWAWNHTSMPRISVLRGLTIVQVVGWLTLDAAKGHITQGCGILAILTLTNFLPVEWRAARSPPRTANAMIVAYRSTLFGTIMGRLLPASMMATALALSLSRGEYAWAICSAIGVANLWLYYSLTPEDPPQRRKRNVTDSTMLRTPLAVAK